MLKELTLLIGILSASACSFEGAPSSQSLRAHKLVSDAPLCVNPTEHCTASEPALCITYCEAGSAFYQCNNPVVMCDDDFGNACETYCVEDDAPGECSDSREGLICGTEVCVEGIDQEGTPIALCGDDECIIQFDVTTQLETLDCPIPLPCDEPILVQGEGERVEVCQVQPPTPGDDPDCNASAYQDDTGEWVSNCDDDFGEDIEPQCNAPSYQDEDGNWVDLCAPQGEGAPSCNAGIYIDDEGHVIDLCAIDA